MRRWVVLNASSFLATCSLRNNWMIFPVFRSMHLSLISRKRIQDILRRKFNPRANSLNFRIRIDHLNESRISSNFLTCLWASINIFLRNLTTLLPASGFDRSTTVRLVLINFMQSFSEWIPDLYFWKTHLKMFFVCVFFCLFVYVFELFTRSFCPSYLTPLEILRNEVRK